MLSTNCSGRSLINKSWIFFRGSWLLLSISKDQLQFTFKFENLVQDKREKTMQHTHGGTIYQVHIAHICYLIQLIAADVKQFIVLSNIILKLKKSPPEVFPNRLMSILLASHNQNCYHLKYDLAIISYYSFKICFCQIGILLIHKTNATSYIQLLYRQNMMDST